MAEDITRVILSRIMCIPDVHAPNAGSMIDRSRVGTPTRGLDGGREAERTPPGERHLGVIRASRTTLRISPLLPDMELVPASSFRYWAGLRGNSRERVVGGFQSYKALV